MSSNRHLLLYTHLIGLFSLDSESLSPTSMKEQVDIYINKISEWLGEEPVELKTRLGFDGTDDLATKYENAIQSAKDKFNGEDITPFFEENSINTQEEINRWIEVANGCNTATEAKKKYLETDTPNAPQISISDAITQLNSQLRPAFDSLKSAYQSIFTEDGFTLKNVDISMLDSIKSILYRIKVIYCD